MIESLIKGFIVGMGASIPLGPLGVMCIQKTLSKGRASGIATGLGVAVTDTLFASLAILSLALIQDFVNNNKSVVLIVGGLIIALIGVKIFVTNPVKQIRANRDGKRLGEDFLSAFIMTITNPGAIFLILGLFTFTGLEVDSSSSWKIIILALTGLFIGAISWWIILSTSINLFRARFRLRQLLLINRISGLIIAAIGLVTLFDGLWRVISN